MKQPQRCLALRLSQDDTSVEQDTPGAMLYRRAIRERDTSARSCAAPQANFLLILSPLDAHQWRTPEAILYRKTNIYLYFRR